MIACDSPKLLSDWFEGLGHAFKAHNTNALLRLPEGQEDLNKAIVTLETKSHVGSITLWGSGMLEFIVLDIFSQNEVIVADRELNSIEDIGDELNKSLSEFFQISQER
jgi:hypothetical protein